MKGHRYSEGVGGGVNFLSVGGAHRVFFQEGVKCTNTIAFVITLSLCHNGLTFMLARFEPVILIL